MDDGESNFVKIIANILGIEDINLNSNESFISLGMDSLSCTEIKQILKKKYNISLSFEEISFLTIEKLKDLPLSNPESI